MIKQPRAWLIAAVAAGTTALPLALSAMAPVPIGTSVKAPMEAAQQRQFSTTDQAVEDLVAASRSDDLGRLLRILGPRGARLIRSGDGVADREARQHFVASYDQAHRIGYEEPNKAVLFVGSEDWPMPIPLVRTRGGWRFDTKAGEQEILDRRVGYNELSAIEVCRTYVQAQREYARMQANAGAGRAYAQRFMSQPRTHDGLYWPVSSDEKESPLGPLVAQARAEGYAPEPAHHERHPYFGYYYKILTRQGGHARGGARNYISPDGRMTGGFALLAYPATYGDSGIMTFIVNRSGIVFEKNLGTHTVAAARAIREYDPDPSWRPASAQAR